MSTRKTPTSLLVIALAFSATAQAQTTKTHQSQIRPAGYAVAGAVVEPGCCDMASSCGECCPPCVSRRPCILAAIFRGIDCLLNQIFCCHCCHCCPGCMDSCCAADPCPPASYRTHDGGCDAPAAAPQPSNPFIEDPVEAPTTGVDARLYRRPVAVSRSHATIRQGRRTVSIRSDGVPRPLVVQEAAPLKVTQTTEAIPARRNSSVRTTSNDSRQTAIPANPLRP